MSNASVTTINSGGCLGYVVADGADALVIDPTRDTAKFLAAAAASGARIRFVIDTHTHADHMSGARLLADETGAKLVMSSEHAEQWRAAEGRADALGIGDILRANAGVRVDVAVDDRAALPLGSSEIHFLSTPGHTLDSLVVRLGDRAFTGDTLLIGQTGRCDLPGGDGGLLFESLFTRLRTLPDETFVYPGHDYQGQTMTALGFERTSNAFLKPRAMAAFQAFLKTAFPTLTGAGMQCGASACGPTAPGGQAASDPLRDEVAGFMDGYFFGGQRASDFVAPAALDAELRSGAPVVVLDVREPSEYVEGHIEGAFNLSVHELDGKLDQVPAPRDARVVTVCKAGKRAGWAAMFLRVAGYRDVRNVTGGMLAWAKDGHAMKLGGSR